MDKKGKERRGKMKKEKKLEVWRKAYKNGLEMAP